MKKTQNTYFAEEIWHQIYPHFPLNCIFKFKCVSKVWKSTLSSPNFIYKWVEFNKSTDLPWTLAYNFKNNERYYSVAHLDSHSQCITRDFLLRFIRPDDNSTRLVGSSNGLALFSKEGRLMRRFYYVCNPLTKQMISLPEPVPHAYGSTIGGLICECSSMSTSYKVVLASFICYKGTIELQIFSSDSGKWRTFQLLSPPDVSLEMPTKHVVLHGYVLSWIDDKNRIITYNLENIETGVCQCNLIELPDFPLTEMCTHCLGESEGLILYARVNNCQGTLSVWVTEEETFRLLHDDIELDNLLGKINVRLYGSSAEFFNCLSRIKVLGFSPVNKDVVLIGCDSYVWAYNVRTNVYEELTKPSSWRCNHIICCPPRVLKAMPTILPPPSWT